MKHTFYLAAAIALCASCCNRGPEHANRAEAIAAEMRNPTSKYVVVACHRGDWRNFPENSIPAIESIIRSGADIMELDIHRTKDSVLVLSHDADVRRCTNFNSVFKKVPGKSPRISDLTYEEICKLSLKRAHGVTIDTLRMPTLRQALLCTRDRICVNIDKGFDYYDQVIDITEELGVTGQVLIKSSKSIEEVAAMEGASESRMMYMPVINIQKAKGRELFHSYLDNGVVPMAYEVCYHSLEDGAFDDACRTILDQGSKIWVNTIWASLCGGDGHDDDAAFISGDPGSVYQPLIDRGVSMIQTDRPELVIGWLAKHGHHGKLKYTRE